LAELWRSLTNLPGAMLSHGEKAIFHTKEGIQCFVQNVGQKTMIMLSNALNAVKFFSE
jgi:hypothetical protein